MNEDDVTLDYYSERTLSVIRFRSLHTRLALALLEEGKREKAVEVLDKCMELAPHHVLPYDNFIAGITFPQQDGTRIHHEGIIEAYYMCGETEKANDLLSEYYDILMQQMTFFNSLNSTDQESVQQEMYQTMAQVEELRMLLVNYRQEDKMLELGF